MRDMKDTARRPLPDAEADGIIEGRNAVIETLVADDRLPMFNRATQGVYAPGSTFKMCTAVAALESGIITPSSIIQDRGIYTYYTHP